MKAAIIADVHSNLRALEVVVGEIRRQRIDLTVCSGDIIGYGSFPNECAGIVMGMTSAAVLGNHDFGALANDTSGMNPYAAAACRWTSKRIDKRTREYLSSLRVESRFDLAGERAAMYHGSVGNYLEYTYEDRVDGRIMERASADILILGHTHIPYVKRLGKGLVVNPGSVGQPRDGDPRASLAIYDSESRTCTITRLDYDVEGAAQGIIGAGLPKILADRLFDGR